MKWLFTYFKLLKLYISVTMFLIIDIFYKFHNILQMNFPKQRQNQNFIDMKFGVIMY